MGHHQFTTSIMKLVTVFPYHTLLKWKTEGSQTVQQSGQDNQCKLKELPILPFEDTSKLFYSKYLWNRKRKLKENNKWNHI